MEAGDLISGKYRLQRLLGAGSMGSVWAARNELTNRDFAIKFLLPELSKNEDALNRFFLEARACGQIKSAAIVDVYDMGKADDGSPYLVMELLDGEGLDACIARQGRMRSVDVCRYLAIVARGLDEAHARGLIHRDLKPGNVFLALDNAGAVIPKVLDFGISKETSEHFDMIRTSAGAVLGSPAYMSPEQARGELEVDARTDLWALGVMLYEALSGELPFDANNYNALMLKIITEPHQPLLSRCPDVPPELSDLCDRLLEKERDQRIRSAGDLADRLERIYHKMTGSPLMHGDGRHSIPPEGGTTLSQGWLARTRHGSPRRSRVMALGAAIALCGIALGGLMAMRAPAAIEPAKRFGTVVNTMAMRGGTDVDQAVADRKARQAEAAMQNADKLAEQAEKRLDAPEASAPRPSAGPARRKKKDESHGGVVSPGF